MNPEHLIIFDTTLRDGEQSPGASMTREEKVRIARQLEKMRVDVIEAGFPAASEGDFEAVRAVANAVRNSTVCGLARALERDIDRAGEALRSASSSRIHTFIATSAIHMEKKLRMSPEQVIEQAVKAVQWARRYTDDVEFSPEDAGRSDPDFLCRVLEAVINAGARTLNIPDTVGYSLPDQFGALIRTLRERIPNADKAIFSGIVTMIWVWLSQTRFLRCSMGHVKWNVRLMAWANAQVMQLWKKWSWQCARAQMCSVVRRALMPPKSYPLHVWWQALPDSPCSPIRRSLASMPLRMSRVSIRMVC